MRLPIVILLALLPLMSCAADQQTPRVIETVAESSRQWTGLAVSQEGRIFVCYPRWSDDVPVSVAEIGADGTATPYPNRARQAWNADGDAASRFVCVQSVHVDASNRLWILDPANPKFEGIVEGGPKLMQVDLTSNRIVRSYRFDAAVTPQNSYLNDVRIDVASGTAFMTDSGIGGLVVLDLDSGEARRVLDGHPSTLAEPIEVVIDGTPFTGTVHADGIAIDAAGGWIYWQALTGRTMYRLPTKLLADPAVGDDALSDAIEVVAESGVSDGLLWTDEGVWVSALEAGAIRRVNPDGSVVTVSDDERIVWPDSFAAGPDGSIYFTTAQIHLGPNPPDPYRILQLTPAAD
jgi:sugar lactone lactonase YvrE